MENFCTSGRSDNINIIGDNNSNNDNNSSYLSSSDNNENESEKSDIDNNSAITDKSNTDYEKTAKVIKVVNNLFGKIN